MSDTSLRVVIAGGGTGGHLFPGLAIAREILARRPDAVVTFAGTARGIEARAVPAAGFELDTIRSLGLKGKSPLDRARGVATLPLSAVDAMGVIARRRPHVVIGVGGYSSGPIAVAAWLRRVPVLLVPSPQLIVNVKVSAVSPPLPTLPALSGLLKPRSVNEPMFTSGSALPSRISRQKRLIA